MDIVTIDFETFYDQEYSLSKLTTEEYIRDDRFEVIGVSVKVNDNVTDFYSGNDVRGFLNSLDYSDKAILCHNTAFDGAILSWVYGITPKLWLDTLSMSRPTCAVTVGGTLHNLALFFKLGQKGTDVIEAKGKRRKDFTPQQLAAYGRYCANDTELTYKLFKKLAAGFPTSEIQVIDQTIRMFTEPMLELNRTLLNDHLKKIVKRKNALLDKISNGDRDAAKKFLMSNAKFANLLGALGVNVPMKMSPRTGKMTFAFAKTDQGFKDLFQHPNPAVVALVEARAGVKSTIAETRTQRLIGISMRGPLPAQLVYYAAHTGRFGGSGKINLQNLPARGDTTIRKSLCAPEGYKVVACDSSQIEARVLAFLAGQKDLVEAFRQGRDVYSEFASSIYGRTITKADKTERFVGKTCILGLGYGMGHVKFRDTLAQGGVIIDEHEAKRIVYLYRSRYPMIKKLWTVCDHVLMDMVAGRSGIIGNLLPYDKDGIQLPNGLTLKYNALQAGQNGFEYISDQRAFRKFIARVVTGASPDTVTWTNIYGGKVVENIVQALARIVVAEQMTAIGHYYHVVLQVHDEIVVCVLEAVAKAAQQVMERIMSTPPTWASALPVACESGVGDNYGEAK